MSQIETNPGLTTEQEKQILKYAATGMSGRTIAEQTNITVSQATVNRFLREHRKARAETTKAIVQEHLSATLPADLEQIDRLNARLEKMRARVEAIGASLPMPLELSIIDRQFKAIDLKLKYSGAGEKNEVAELLERLSGDDA